MADEPDSGAPKEPEEDVLSPDAIAELLSQAQVSVPEPVAAAPAPEEAADEDGDDDTLSPEEIAALVGAGSDEPSGTDSASPAFEAPDRGAEVLSPQGPPRGRDDAFDNETDILDQFTIDSLLSEAVHGVDQNVVLRFDGTRFHQKEKVSVEAYDFSNPVFMTENEMRQVRIRHEQFIHHLAARLSMFLRMDFGLKMSKIYTTQYRNYTENIPNPTHISLFRLEEFHGVGIVDMNPRLAMTVVDRLLGGAGHSIREERYLTELETVLIEDVSKIILEEWCRQWEDMFDLNATVIGAESNGRYLQTAPHDAIMLILTMEASLGDCSEPLQIALPYYTIEPVIKRMQQDAKKHHQMTKETKSDHWWDSCDDIGVPVSAQWEAFSCPVRDLLHLRKGDVLELPRELLENTQVRCNNAVRFMGKVGVQNDRISIQITRSIQEKTA